VLEGDFAEMPVPQALVGHVLPVYPQLEPLWHGYKRKNQQVTGALDLIATILLVLTFYTG
jgi:hypothetical protein